MNVLENGCYSCNALCRADYLTDKPLSALTFRGLATGLGVSSFTLVYHFGTGADLVREIIGAIATRQRGFETVLDPQDVTLDSYFGGLRRTFVGLDSRNASIESRLLIDTFYGIQVGLVINDDDDRATEAFDRALQQHHERITTLSGQPA
jgi:AcrR family transcriptional regulator